MAKPIVAGKLGFYYHNTGLGEKWFYDGADWVNWIDLMNANNSPLTSKGDIYTYNTDNARQAIGSNGQILFADSSSATGLDWRGLTSTDLPAHTHAYDNYSGWKIATDGTYRETIYTLDQVDFVPTAQTTISWVAGEITVGLASSGVTPGSYTATDLTVDAYGRVTSAISGTVNVGVTSVSATTPVLSSGGPTPIISMPVATGSVNGYLSKTDWNTFNGKTSNLGDITSVTISTSNGLNGGVTATSGAFSANIGIDVNAITTRELNVANAGMVGQVLRSDGDLSFSWYTLPAASAAPTLDSVIGEDPDTDKTISFDGEFFSDTITWKDSANTVPVIGGIYGDTSSATKGLKLQGQNYIEMATPLVRVIGSFEATGTSYVGDMAIYSSHILAPGSMWLDVGVLESIHIMGSTMKINDAVITLGTGLAGSTAYFSGEARAQTPGSMHLDTLINKEYADNNYMSASQNLESFTDPTWAQLDAMPIGKKFIYDSDANSLFPVVASSYGIVEKHGVDTAGEPYETYSLLWTAGSGVTYQWNGANFFGVGTLTWTKVLVDGEGGRTLSSTAANVDYDVVLANPAILDYIYYSSPAHPMKFNPSTYTLSLDNITAAGAIYVGGKASSALTIAGDANNTLTTKSYVDAATSISSDLPTITRKDAGSITIDGNPANPVSVQWDTQVISDAAFPYNSTYKDRLTVSKAGKYLITGTVTIQVHDGTGHSDTGYYVVKVLLNGATEMAYAYGKVESAPFGGPYGETIAFSVVVDMAAGQYLTVTVGTDALAATGQSVLNKSRVSMVALIGAQGPEGQGVHAGGSVGQMLTKKSGLDYDTEWKDPSGVFVRTDGGSIMTAGLKMSKSSGDVLSITSYSAVNKIRWYDPVDLMTDIATINVDIQNDHTLDLDGYSGVTVNRDNNNGRGLAIGKARPSTGRNLDVLGKSWFTGDSSFSGGTVNINGGASIIGPDGVLNVKGNSQFEGDIHMDPNSTYPTRYIHLLDGGSLGGYIKGSIDNNAASPSVRIGSGSAYLQVSHEAGYPGVSINREGEPGITGLNVHGASKFDSVVLGIAPTADLHLATKKYVDDNAGGLGSILNLTTNGDYQVLIGSGNAPYYPNGKLKLNPNTGKLTGNEATFTKVNTPIVRNRYDDILIDAGGNIPGFDTSFIYLDAYHGTKITNKGNTGGYALRVVGKTIIEGTIEADDFILSSDRRLKEHDVDLEAHRLRPVAFDWIKDGKSDIGFIAQEVEEFYPEVVITDEDGMKSLSYSKITAINAARINELEDRIAKLEELILKLI